MIEYLSIDLETKSGTDLSKSGVYRYTEDPEFEILLFGYSVNGGEVSVIDVACGEQIPGTAGSSPCCGSRCHTPRIRDPS